LVDAQEKTLGALKTEGYPSATFLNVYYWKIIINGLTILPQKATLNYVGFLCQEGQRVKEKHGRDCANPMK